VCAARTRSQEIGKHLDELIRDKFGRKPILYLLVGRNKAYFFPDTLKLLAAGDAIRSQTRFGGGNPGRDA